MFYGYTEIDIRVLFTLDGDDEGLRGHSKKICKPRFNTDIRKYYFSNRVIGRWNSLNQDTVDAPILNWIKLHVDAQRWVYSWTSPLNSSPCHVGWPQGKIAQGKHNPDEIWTLGKNPVWQLKTMKCVCLCPWSRTYSNTAKSAYNAKCRTAFQVRIIYYQHRSYDVSAVACV